MNALSIVLGACACGRGLNAASPGVGSVEPSRARRSGPEIVQEIAASDLPQAAVEGSRRLAQEEGLTAYVVVPRAPRFRAELPFQSRRTTSPKLSVSETLSISGTTP